MKGQKWVWSHAYANSVPQHWKSFAQSDHRMKLTRFNVHKVGANSIEAVNCSWFVRTGIIPAQPARKRSALCHLMAAS